MHRLGCLRGIGTLTGLALAVEVGDWDRFTGKTIGSFIGLVPSEHSSGQSRVQGSITQDREHPPASAVGRGGLAPPTCLPGRKTMRDRWELAGPAARARGDEDTDGFIATTEEKEAVREWEAARRGVEVGSQR